MYHSNVLDSTSASYFWEFISEKPYWEHSEWHEIFWKKGKDPHPQDKIQQLEFTKDPRPLYYKTPPCVFYYKHVRLTGCPGVNRTLIRAKKLCLCAFFSSLSGPNRAMQPRCAMRFKAHVPKSLAMRFFFRFFDAKTHSLDLKSQENTRNKACENPAMLACDGETIF